MSKGPNSPILLVSSEGLSPKKGVVCLFSRPCGRNAESGEDCCIVYITVFISP